MSPPATQADPLRLALTTPRVWLWITLVVSSLLRVAAIAHSFFWADDFVHIWRAWREPIAEFSLQLYNGHFEPLGMVVFWVLTRVAPQAWGPAMLYLCALAIALPLVFWSVARKLMGDGWPTTATVAVFCAWPGTLMAQTWFAAGVQATAFLFVLLAIRVYLGASRWRLPVLVLLLVVGASFYQRALALPLVLMAVAVLRTDGPPLMRLIAVLRREAWLWVTLWVLALVGLVAGVVLGAPTAPAGQDVTAANTVQGAWYALVPGLLQSLAGMMWAWGETRTTLPEPMPVGLLVVLLVAVGVLVAVGRARDRWQTTCALLAVASLLAVEAGSVILVRTGFIGPAITMDPRLNTMSGIIAILAISSFFWDRPHPPGAPTEVPAADTGAPAVGGPAERWSREWGARRALVPAVVAAIVLGGLISMGSYVGNMDGRRSSQWFAQVRASIAAQPEQTVYASVASPEYMLDPFWTVRTDDGHRQAIGTIRTLLDVGPAAPTFNQPTDTAATFNGFGDLGQVSVDTRSTTPEQFDDTCPYPARDGRVDVVMAEVLLENPVLELQYDAASAGPAQIGFGGSTTIDVQLSTGTNTLLVFPPAGPFDGFSVTTVDADSQVCVQRASAGVPFAD